MREDYVCHDRREVLDLLGQFEHQPDEHVELLQQSDKVVLGLGGSVLDRVGDVPLQGQIFQVFPFEDGRVVHMQDFLTRGGALAAAGATGSAEWRA